MRNSRQLRSWVMKGRSGGGLDKLLVLELGVMGG